MPYPSEQELLAADPLLEWIDEHVLRQDPYAFRDANFRPIIAKTVELLGVDANGVYCIGSGAVGLSMSPGKVDKGTLKAFDHESDLDLAVVSEWHFETAWRDLRRATQPTVSYIDDELRAALKWQRKRFFDGAIIASELLPFVSFGNTWISSLTQLSQHIAVLLDREIDIKVWIYRDYWSLRNYVAEGIMRCRRQIQHLEDDNDRV